MSKDFQVRMMGTASAMPVSGKYQSAQVLCVHGRYFLIDCGEGVQQQMTALKVPMMKIDSIFISHIHGDHVFGLFGLLSTLGMKGRTAAMNIYGPVNLGPIIKFFLSYYGDGLAYEIRFVPLKGSAPEVIYDTKNLEVVALPLNHGIETYGYIFREKEPMLNVYKWAVEAFGLSLTEIGALKRGEDISRADGTVLTAERCAYKPFEPAAYAYISDTAPFPELAAWLKGVTTLYHEATYLSGLEDQAAKRHHSTTLQAASVARDAGVSRLIIGHYSSREKDIALYQAECRTIFPETFAATDGDSFEI
ncbi:MAG: ribonuclease Z [Bacteroidales bacterium]|nr:ribonuclease Z [Bacteroidales bacterium]MBQ8461692.1 ribonuclease Z [Bacteroidales bacterium]